MSTLHISPRSDVHERLQGCIVVPMATATTPEQFNHIFRTFLGIPPTKGDKPLCGADLPDSWDFPGHDRPPCPACQEVADNG